MRQLHGDKVISVMAWAHVWDRMEGKVRDEIELTMAGDQAERIREIREGVLAQTVLSPPLLTNGIESGEGSLDNTNELIRGEVST